MRSSGPSILKYHLNPSQRLFSQAMMLYPNAPEAASRFLKFVNASPTPFHAVQNAALRLEKAGFSKVRDRCYEI